MIRQQFGLGLASAILIDAFIIRSLIVPAVMQLFGARAWWLPRWISSWLPRIALEGRSRVAESAGESHLESVNKSS